MANLSDFRTVRFFGRGLDPAEYRRGFGIWGFLIHVVNVLRMWLERKLVGWIIRVEAKASDLEPGAVSALVAVGQIRLENPMPDNPTSRAQRYAGGSLSLEDSVFKATLAEAMERQGSREARYASRERSVVKTDLNGE